MKFVKGWRVPIRWIRFNGPMPWAAQQQPSIRWSIKVAVILKSWMPLPIVWTFILSTPTSSINPLQIFKKDTRRFSHRCVMMPPGGILVDKVTMANMQVTCYECQKTRCMRPVLIALDTTDHEQVVCSISWSESSSNSVNGKSSNIDPTTCS